MEKNKEHPEAESTEDPGTVALGNQVNNDFGLTKGQSTEDLGIVQLGNAVDNDFGLTKPEAPKK